MTTYFSLTLQLYKFLSSWGANYMHREKSTTLTNIACLTVLSVFCAFINSHGTAKQRKHTCTSVIKLYDISILCDLLLYCISLKH